MSKKYIFTRSVFINVFHRDQRSVQTFCGFRFLICTLPFDRVIINLQYRLTDSSNWDSLYNSKRTARRLVVQFLAAAACMANIPVVHRSE